MQQLLRPLLKEDPNLLLYERFLIVTPIEHHVCALLIDGSSTREEFVVEVWPVLLAKIGNRDWLGLIGTGFSWPYDKYWRIDEPEYPLNRRMQIKYSLIPELRQLHPFFRFRNYSRTYFDKSMGGFPTQEMLLSIAYGDFKEAAEWMAKDWRHEPRQLINSHVKGLGDRLSVRGAGISADDKRALIAILHEREAAAIHALKLEKYWQPTPFPAEEQGLV